MCVNQVNVLLSSIETSALGTDKAQSSSEFSCYQEKLMAFLDQLIEYGQCADEWRMGDPHSDELELNSSDN
jgi:hypothetical protein